MLLQRVLGVFEGRSAASWRHEGRRGLAGPAKAGGPAKATKAVKGVAGKTAGGGKKTVKQIEWVPDASKLNLNPLKEYAWLKEPKQGWGDRPRRFGLVGFKMGMIRGYDKYGGAHPLTVIQVENAWVTKNRTKESDGFCAVQIGFGDVKEKNQTKSLLALTEKAGVPPCYQFKEFRVSEQGLAPVGTEITCRHFVPGQYVDVQGITSGKGFQGGMKRWGFKGQPASHGVSASHRSIGSHGSSQDPGRTRPYKKMPGNMGNKKKMIEGLYVFRIDVPRNLIFLHGCVPGKAGGQIMIRDAFRKPATLFNGDKLQLPWPTFVPKAGDAPVTILEAPLPKRNSLDERFALDPVTMQSVPV